MKWVCFIDSSIRIEISGDTENAKRLKNNENVITKTPVDLNADNQKVNKSATER